MKNPRIKFKVIFLKNFYNLKNVKKELEELINWCNVFEDLSLTKPEKEDGKYSSGNLSFRASDDSFIITASCLKSKRNLNKDDFVLVKSCDLRNKIVYACSSKNPSSESMLHYAIYKNRNDVNAIFHAHFPSKDFEERIRKLALAKKNKTKEIKIAFTKKEEKFGTISLVNSVLEILNKKNFIIMKNHGFLSLGKDMKEAGEIVLKLLKNLNYIK